MPTDKSNNKDNPQESLQEDKDESSYWQASSVSSWKHVTCVCLGTGRFLRSVLVPIVMKAAQLEQQHDNDNDSDKSPGSVVLIQPRGRSFVDFMKQQHSQSQQSQQSPEHADCYPVETVLSPTADSSSQPAVHTDWVPLAGVFPCSSQFFQTCLVECWQSLQIIGVGVTEAGLASPQTAAMQFLFQLLYHLYQWDTTTPQQTATKPKKWMVINTDNVPHNGTVLQGHMMELARQYQLKQQQPEQESSEQSLLDFVQHRIVFLNSMVDRIVSAHPDHPHVPRAEPIPAKALVVLDPQNDLPPSWPTLAALANHLGLVIRHDPRQLQADVALKLRIANGTHTAVAYALALSGITNTTALSSSAMADCMTYLDALVHHQIVPAILADPSLSSVVTRDSAVAVWEDWRRRLCHASFGISTLFITQNGPTKGGLRFGPTLEQLVQRSSLHPKQEESPTLQVSLAFAVAVLLHWLTPDVSSLSSTEQEDVPEQAVYRGKLVPFQENDNNQDDNNQDNDENNEDTTVTYADGLRYNLRQGWYEYKCQGCTITLKGDDSRALIQVLLDVARHEQQQRTRRQASAYTDLVKAYVTSHVFPSSLQSRNRNAWQQRALDDFCQAVATLYARFRAGDQPLHVLHEMVHPPTPNTTTSVFGSLQCQTPCHALVDDPTHGKALSSLSIRPLYYRPTAIPNDSALMHSPIVTAEELAHVVVAEVASVQVIDLHTHLLPPEHGPLCLWGIDELLTYHYLVAEYFMTAPPSVTPDTFFNTWTKMQQADCIWQALFVDRLPLSEACRGVLTTLLGLGLQQAVHDRDLSAIRAFYQTFRRDGVEGAQRFSNLIFDTAGVQYNVMTNIPFEAKEAQYWHNKTVHDTQHYKSAVRVDPLLQGDATLVQAALSAAGYPTTLEGARQYLRDWCDVMKPDYVIASTPHDFVLPDADQDPATARNSGTSSTTTVKRTKASINPSALQEPGAFARAILETTTAVSACTSSADGTTADDEVPSVINETSDYFTEVLMKVCQERDLPLALKIGAHRAVNPDLQQAGDGVVAFCDTAVLRRLCTKFPKVRFLATFLSRNNQHEACVLATKFRNLHLYGCWWFCNNPSIVREITQMRVELLGTAFTSQHSDARVLDQLVYKWAHSRAVIAQVLVTEYQKLLGGDDGIGWRPTRREIRRDVQRLFGGSYQEFMAKSFL